MMTSERRHWHRSGAYFISITLNTFHTFFCKFYCWLWATKNAVWVMNLITRVYFWFIFIIYNSTFFHIQFLTLRILKIIYSFLWGTCFIKTIPYFVRKFYFYYYDIIWKEQRTTIYIRNCKVNEPICSRKNVIPLWILGGGGRRLRARQFMTFS